MGLSKGSISLSRYRLIGDHSQNFETLNKSFRAQQVGKLVIGRSKKELNFGWSRPPLEDDREERFGDYWDLSDCRLDQGYLLRLRIERKKVPLELMQEIFRQKLAETNSGLEQAISRNAQKILRDEVRDSLRLQALPSISHLDSYWRDDGVINLFSSSKSSKEIFEELFTKTFAKILNSVLIPVQLPLIGMSEKEWTQSGPFLKKLEPLLPGSQYSNDSGEA